MKKLQTSLFKQQQHCSAINDTHPSNVLKFCPFCGSKNFIWDNKKSHNCLDCGKRLYTNEVGAVIALIENEKGECLFTTRKFDPAKGKLDLPGGFIDLGETAEQAVVREIKEELNLGEVKLIKTFKGKEIEGVTTIHPFYNRESVIILGDHVTDDAGTGCVHTAPGHGAEDFYIGMKYGLDVLCPVDEKGYMIPYTAKVTSQYEEAKAKGEKDVVVSEFEFLQWIHREDGINIYNLVEYGFLSPIILISYLLPFISMSNYIIISTIILTIISTILLYKFLYNHKFVIKIQQHFAVLEK